MIKSKFMRMACNQKTEMNLSGCVIVPTLRFSFTYQGVRQMQGNPKAAEVPPASSVSPVSVYDAQKQGFNSDIPDCMAFAVSASVSSPAIKTIHKKTGL